MKSGKILSSCLLLLLGSPGLSNAGAVIPAGTVPCTPGHVFETEGFCKILDRCEPGSDRAQQCKTFAGSAAWKQTVAGNSGAKILGLADDYCRTKVAKKQEGYAKSADGKYCISLTGQHIIVYNKDKAGYGPTVFAYTGLMRGVEDYAINLLNPKFTGCEESTEWTGQKESPLKSYLAENETKREEEYRATKLYSWDAGGCSNQGRVRHSAEGRLNTSAWCKPGAKFMHIDAYNEHRCRVCQEGTEANGWSDAEKCPDETGANVDLVQTDLKKATGWVWR
jgi:hypothetical protein